MANVLPYVVAFTLCVTKTLFPFHFGRCRHGVVLLLCVRQDDRARKPVDRAGNRPTCCFWSTPQATWTTTISRGICSASSLTSFSSWTSTLDEHESPSLASATLHRSHRNASCYPNVLPIYLWHL